MTDMSCCLVVQFVVIHLCLISFCCLFLFVIFLSMQDLTMLWVLHK